VHCTKISAEFEFGGHSPGITVLPQSQLKATKIGCSALREHYKSCSTIHRKFAHPWSMCHFSDNQLTLLSSSKTAPSRMPHFTCRTSFLLLFMFLIGSIFHHHPTLFHRHTPILDRLLIFLWRFPLSSKNFSFHEVFPFIAVYPFLRLIFCNYDHSLFESHWRR